ncbi:MAG: hypothetical protein EOP11_24230 [Proteobacteria bacterium]|nr:MAG: hypothetical protein EOP11_24230 [Pseudomonadota bacterium]
MKQVKFMLLAAALVILPNLSQAAERACEGDDTCLQTALSAHVKKELNDSRSSLRREFNRAVETAAHYECFGEMENPIEEYAAHADVKFLLGSQDDERERGAPRATYTAQYLASIALPEDCNEGGVIHNWKPRLLVEFTAVEMVRDSGVKPVRKSLAIKMKPARNP